MAAKKGRRGPQQPIKGFRPGKEPAHLKRQRAKARLGSDATWMEKQTVEAVAGRSASEVEALVRKWSLALLAVGVVLGILGVFLYSWAVWAGVVLHLLTAVSLFLAYRVRKQGPGLVEVARSLQ